MIHVILTQVLEHEPIFKTSLEKIIPMTPFGTPFKVEALIFSASPTEDKTERPPF
jgi:hypothetical protein